MDINQIFDLYQQHPCITTDSRHCPVGSIFIALKGESFDGNRFAASALEKGCSYAIVDEAQYATDSRFILVDDTLVTYKELARLHRRQFNIPVVGITGTNGKTTTKELIAAVLSKKYRVLATEANYNNDVGVPRTLLRISPEHEIAVVEMGASHPGDIRKLVEYAEPTCGLITNVGVAHLQGFGSFEGVKRTKGELYDFLKAHEGLVFLNSSNENLSEMVTERGITHTLTYGEDGTGEVTGSVSACSPFLEFNWQWKGSSHHVSTHLIGAYNLDNMLAAITVGLHFGVSITDICDALEAYQPGNNRSQLTVTPHNKLIVDAYNANPTSMAAALDNFARMDCKPKMAILGDMRELGAVSAAEHQKTVDRLATAGFDTVWLVGPEFAMTRCDFRKFADTEEVKKAIAAHQPQGFYILIKGSNDIRLFELPSLL